MSPIQECVTDWQLACGEIKKRSGYLLQTGLWSDCTFLVGSEPEQAEMKAHILILAMASPVFEAMFFGPIAEGKNAIAIPDMTPDAFKGLLEYIYTDNIDISSFNTACELYYGAQKYMLPHLLTVCTMYLSCNLDPSKAAQTYEFAQMIGEEKLIEESLEMIKSETQKVLADISFEELEPNTVLEIFSMEPLNIASELDLFTAAERYVKAQDKRSWYADTSPSNRGLSMLGFTQLKGLPVNDVEMEMATGSEISHHNELEFGTVNVVQHNELQQNLPEKNINQNPAETLDDENTMSDVCEGIKKSDEIIRKAIQQIRFLTLSTQQLAECSILKSLLTDSEVLALFMNIASSEACMPMPRGFSTSRVDRNLLLHRRTK